MTVIVLFATAAVLAATVFATVRPWDRPRPPVAFKLTDATFFYVQLDDESHEWTDITRHIATASVTNTAEAVWHLSTSTHSPEEPPT